MAESSSQNELTGSGTVLAGNSLIYGWEILKVTDVQKGNFSLASASHKLISL